MGDRMTREDADYRRILLLCGVWNDFDEWLDDYLEKEAPLSDVVLDLLDCRNDIKKVEHVLRLYCLEAPYDEESVYTRLRLYLKEGYQSGNMTKDNVMSLIFRFSKNIPCEAAFSNDCLTLSNYYALAEENIVDMKRFDQILFRFLDTGEYFDTADFWENGQKERKCLWHRKKQ
jgi:hypothetical protein